MLPDTRVTVVYFWEEYAGFDGCNWFHGVYSATTGGELRMQMPASTRNYCGPEELHEQSALYVSSLQNVTEYRLEGEQLIANTVDDQRLLTHNTATPVKMLGTEWGLAFWWLADSERWSPVVPASMTTIIFGEGGEAAGQLGGLDGFQQIVGDPRGGSGLDGFALGAGRHDDHRDIGEAGVLADGGQAFQSTLVRQGQVEEDQVRLVLPGLLDGRLAIGGLDGRETQVADHAPDDAAGEIITSRRPDGSELLET